MTLKVKSIIGALIAFGLLIPGLFLEMLTITFKAEIKAGALVNFKTDLINETRSILGTVEHLWSQGFYDVSFLIFFFSVMVPTLKILGTLWLGFSEDQSKSKAIQKVLNFISKWSMADVFVVGVLIAYLSMGQSNEQTFDVAVFGMKLQVLLKTISDASLHQGFYFFLAYCIASIALLQFVTASKSKEV